ncbi:MAG: nucleoside hydrolase [Bacteroidales bacterium]|nr:nucleoside hydrolase [Bacteroidales bacterium]
MKKHFKLIYWPITCLISLTLSFISCEDSQPKDKINVIFDTDANNELDDQHAIAYLLFNGDHFHVHGITVNKTQNGGEIEKHMEEAERVVELCGLKGIMPVFRGASSTFDSIKNDLRNPAFDGKEAVDFIIGTAKAVTGEKLTIIAVGKITNVALAIHKAPEIIPAIKVVWLGSNYPEPGEYNQIADESALNYVLDTDVELEIVLVRAEKPSGTYAVTARLEDIQETMPGKGPRLKTPVKGRRGGLFYTFGDYSLNLWYTRYDYFDWEDPALALFDVAAVAVVKNIEWSDRISIPAPYLNDSGIWTARPDNSREIFLRENFNKRRIIEDFYNTMENYVLVQSVEE